jgi:RsiW-degrading membrane proteinase PrsW (M82 family)
MRIALYILGFAAVIYALCAVAWWDPFFPTWEGTKIALRVVAASTALGLLIMSPVLGLELTRARRDR